MEDGVLGTCTGPHYEFCTGKVWLGLDDIKVRSAISVSRRKPLSVTLRHGEHSCSLFERMTAATAAGGFGLWRT